MNLSIEDNIEIAASMGSSQIDNSVTNEYLQAIASDKRIRCVQSEKQLSKDTLKRLNQHLFSKRDDIWLRFYSLDSLDLSCLNYVPDLKMFHIDLIKELKNIESLASLPLLTSFNIKIESLTSFSFLQYVTPNLEHLYLGRTKSKRPNLEEVLRFSSLKSLGLRGQSKNIHKLALLKNLQSLSLSGLTSKNITWITDLPQLTTLDIDIFKTDDFTPLENLKKLKSFSVSEIRGATELPFLRNMKGLEELKLTYLNRVKKLPTLGSESTLKSIVIYEMESIENIDFLYGCINLVSARLFFSKKIKVQNLEGFLKLQNLKKASIAIDSIDNDAAIKELMNKFNVKSLR
ncbi:leucine-rich repeat domain-containing protein [Pseudoalteromonas sp. T1lg24]|uniref:leucine-rich repeat domain-containing protein n=1 Tax=Pseudoalteromonas sp. T1lg24 TaxID=2077099 RepID=UPI000CF693C1|nr:leucine-rich repeat domain-containing protein [Pseudoalteromonas sp. T1lg24]